MNRAKNERSPTRDDAWESTARNRSTTEPCTQAALQWLHCIETQATAAAQGEKVKGMCVMRRTAAATATAPFVCGKTNRIASSRKAKEPDIVRRRKPLLSHRMFHRFTEWRLQVVPGSLNGAQALKIVRDRQRPIYAKRAPQRKTDARCEQLHKEGKESLRNSFSGLQASTPTGSSTFRGCVWFVGCRSSKV